MRDYQITSPSLEGVLNHSSILYENIKRPTELLKILDGPSTKGQYKKEPNSFDRKINKDDIKILQFYFNDLYEVFMKKLSFFVINNYSESDETVKMLAMLQEMIKIKRLIGDKS